MLRWPDKQEVESALRRWAAAAGPARPELLRLGYFGSYARGDWGVGSDLDLLLIVQSAVEPFERRPASWNLTALPVPAEAVVYTAGEWEGLRTQGRFGRTLSREVVWVYDKPSSPAA